MRDPDLTVIIPAFNAAPTISRVLHGLWTQRREVPHAVIVVDDGSGDETPTRVADAVRQYGRDYLTLVAQEHRGSASARNAGARASHTPLLLFFGADILPRPCCLKRHRSVHAQFPDPAVGCVGFVTWDPSLPPTPFMVFLEHGGPQNAYGDIAGCRWVSPQKFFYGSNLSLKRSMFDRAGGFDERHFSTYGWEDLELGVRLTQHHFRLYYEPTARGDHAHRVTVPLAERRMRAVGRGARTFRMLHPTIGVLDWSRERTLRPLRQWCFPRPLRVALSWVATEAENSFVLPRLYQRVLSLAFYDGVHGSVERTDEIVDKYQKSP